jgi:aspartokinase/homoserine dehydrogenase 1
MTDTPGKSANPKLIDPSRLRTVHHLTYREGRELGRNGTGLLHPAAIVPLQGSGIPTIIRNTFDPTGEFTTYSDEVDTPDRAGQVMAISLIDDATVIEVYEPNMSDNSGRIAHFSGKLEKNGVNIVDTVTGGADSELFIVSGETEATKATAVLEEAVRTGGSVTPEELALVTLVGYHLRPHSRRIQNILADSDVYGKGNEASYVMTGRDSIRIAVNRDIAAQVVSDAHRLLVEK